MGDNDNDNDNDNDVFIFLCHPIQGYWRKSGFTNSKNTHEQIKITWNYCICTIIIL